MITAIHKNKGPLQDIIPIFKEITKFKLSLSVVISSIAGYLIGIPVFNSDNWRIVVMLSLGGYCIVGASNIFNQIIERNTDLLMNRTKERVIATKKVPLKTAYFIGISLSILGILILYHINYLTAVFAAISLIVYVCIYTPLKTKSPLAVYAGAIPGALPFMLGWVAHSNKFGIEVGILFMIQFFWQFPHFYAIAWFLFDDYKKAGIFMLPTQKKDKNSILIIILFTLLTIISSIVPVIGYFVPNFFGSLYITPLTAFLCLLLGIWMLLSALKLFKKRQNETARTLMLVSVIYITLIQVIYVLDSFLHKP